MVRQLHSLSLVSYLHNTKRKQNFQNSIWPSKFQNKIQTLYWALQWPLGIWSLSRPPVSGLCYVPLIYMVTTMFCFLFFKHLKANPVSDLWNLVLLGSHAFLPIFWLIMLILQDSTQTPPLRGAFLTVLRRTQPSNPVPLSITSPIYSVFHSNHHQHCNLLFINILFIYSPAYPSPQKRINKAQ